MELTKAQETTIKRIRYAVLDATICNRDFPSVPTKDLATLLELFDAQAKELEHATHERGELRELVEELESQVRELS